MTLPAETQVAAFGIQYFLFFIFTSLPRGIFARIFFTGCGTPRATERDKINFNIR